MSEYRESITPNFDPAIRCDDVQMTLDEIHDELRILNGLIEEGESSNMEVLKVDDSLIVDDALAGLKALDTFRSEECND